MLFFWISSLLISSFVLNSYSTETPDYKVLDVCAENPSHLSGDKPSSLFLTSLKTQFISNQGIKQTVLQNAEERERTKQKFLKCSEELMRNSQFKTVEKLIEEILDPLDIDVSSEIRLIGNQIKKEIDSIVNVAQSKRNIQVVTPVFQWIQNNSNIFLQIKFAHRHDAPGCLEVKNEKIEFTETGLYFSAYGIQAQQPIHFLLNLTLFKPIVPENSTWNLESVGRLFVNLAKANEDIWVYLLKNNEKSAGMRLWWEMRDTYKDATKEYDRLVEEQEDIDSGAKKTKTKKTKKPEEIIDDDL